MLSYGLLCQSFSVDVDCQSLIYVDAKFVVPIYGNAKAEVVAEALERIALQLCSPGGITLVKSDPERPRCFYCGGLNDVGAKLCEHCGAKT